MILGLLPMFRYSDSKAAISSILLGLCGFVFVNYMGEYSQAIKIATPLTIALITFIGIGILNRRKPLPEKVENFFEAIENSESEETEEVIVM
jgi:uncharacterized membrane protein (UPF0136 family)